jgi:hypothetical protein
MDQVAGIVGRVLLCLLFVGIPNSAEVESLNNSQWMLAVLGVLILISSRPANTAWKVFDLVAMLLISITGPFCLLLLPLSCLWWWWERSRRTVVLIAIVGAGCCVQLFTLAKYLPPCHRAEIMNPLGIRVLAGQLFLFGALDGGNIVPHAPGQSAMALELGAAVVIVGIALVLYAFWRAPKRLRLFVIFGAIVIASVARRLYCDATWTWPDLMANGYAVRYWYIPRLAVLAVLVWFTARVQPVWLRIIGISALAAIAIASAAHWRYPPLPDFNWPYYAKQVKDSPRGTTVWIPVNPPGWKFSLVSR